jgi:transcriptional regulator with XRE-family HTH domain
MTQATLARRTGLAIASIRAYEHGRRRPSQAALLSLIAALGIPRERANPILYNVGYAADLTGVIDKELTPYTFDELRTRADALRWPAFVTNGTFEVTYLNRAALAVIEADLGEGYLGNEGRNLLAGISDEHVASRLENWDEVVTFICGLIKGDQEWGSVELAHPSPLLHRPLEQFLQGDAERIRRFVQLWQTAPPIPNRLQHSYEVRWRHGRGQTMSFSCRMTLADVYTNVHWNEWLPADARTWQLLAQATREHAPGPTSR